jgi:multiple sugar transport system ATP-binding protein
MIAGLEQPTSGSIRLDGEEVATVRPSRRDIAFVFQLFALYPHLNVQDNIAYPLRSRGVPAGERREQVAEVARILRIEPLLRARISQLAGGDRQRVALARAMVRRPRAFLMDEPLGTLDAEMRAAMRDELRGLHDRIGATTVYVTHDQMEAMSMADRIAVMNGGDVLQAAPPMELYLNPATLFVAGFVGSPPMNLLEAEGHREGGATVLRLRAEGTPQVAAPAVAGGIPVGPLVLGVRPEHLRVGPEESLPASVYGVEYLGSHRILTLDSPAGRLRARVAKDSPLQAGDRTGIGVDPRHAILFDPSSGLALNRMAESLPPSGPQGGSHG